MNAVSVMTGKSLPLLLDCEGLLNRRLRCLSVYPMEEPELPKLEHRKILNFIQTLGLDEIL